MLYFGDSEKLFGSLLSRLLQYFNRYSLTNADLENPDILGIVYEYLIREFVDDAGIIEGYTKQIVLEHQTLLIDSGFREGAIILVLSLPNKQLLQFRSKISLGRDIIS